MQQSHPHRLEALRRVMAGTDLDAFLVPRSDEHLGEYVPPCAERLAWLTGFTGSAGLAVVLRDRAAVFTDGRYTLQLASQADPALFELLHTTDQPPQEWLAAAAPGGRVGYDPRLISEEGLRRYADAGLAMVALAGNPLDAVWNSRPAPPCAPAVPHPLGLAGVASFDKRAAVASALRGAGLDAAVVTDPASLCWLLNLRGGDVDYTPFVLGFVLVRGDGTAALFTDPAKLDAAARDWLGPDVTLQAPEALPDALAALSGQRVRVDAAGSAAWFGQALRAAGATVVDGPDPCALPKACKNPVEQAGARAAHARDAVAVCRFLHWLATLPHDGAAALPRNGAAALPREGAAGQTHDDTAGQMHDGAAGRTTEVAAAERLLRFRRNVPGFRGESFPAISGAGEDGAIIHYRAMPETDRPLRADEVYLIDSGAQYPDGTTDVTRTVWTGPGTPPDELRDRFTRVLQGHIAVASALFPVGVAGPHLDALARRALWQAGLDYDHGTGHGVGSYLSVHEGPCSLSRAGRMVPLAAGMILSDEPGFYLPGAYGIRLENLLLVQPAEGVGGRKPFLRFETLTLAPFDRRLVEPAMLTAAERGWLDAYHARVLREVGPALDGPAQDWLTLACAPLG